MSLQGLVLPYRDLRPEIDPSVFLAPGVCVIGDVTIGARSSIWYNTVVRGDVHYIRIGEGTNIQDGSVVHVSGGKAPTEIGNAVLIGHAAMIHGCRIHDHAYVGMRSVILDDAVIETDSMVAAGALVTPGKVVRSGELWAGSPATKFRDLTAEEIAHNRQSAVRYAKEAAEHRLSIDRSKGL